MPHDALSKAHLSLDKILELTGLTFNDVSDICREKVLSGKQFLSLDLEKADLLLKYLNIDYDLFFNSTYCPQTLLSQFSGKTDTITNNCIGNKGSTVKTVENSLQHHSRTYYNYFLRSHQIHKDFFKKPENRLSVGLFGKTLSHSLKKDSSGSVIYGTGKLNAINHIPKISKILDRGSSILQKYETMIENTHLIESNMKYSVKKKTSSRLLMESKCNDECFSIIKEIDNYQLIFNKNIQGFLAGFSAIVKNQSVAVNILSSSCRKSIFEVVVN